MFLIFIESYGATAFERPEIAVPLAASRERLASAAHDTHREVFSALLDIVPPGVDEIFAIFKILDLAAEDTTIVIDMAPTGHALELLRTPERLVVWTRLLLKSLSAHRTLPLAQELAGQWMV